LNKALPLVLTVLGAIAVAGCVSTRETYTAEGNMVYSVSCRFQAVDACLEEAGKTCGSLGYRQVQPDGTPLIAPVEKPQGGAALIAKIGYDRKIYVKCGHTYQPDA
jgi:hypothetical protein